MLCPFILELIYSSCDERSQISVFLFCFLQFLQMEFSRVGLIRYLRVHFVSVLLPLSLWFKWPLSRYILIFVISNVCILKSHLVSSELIQSFWITTGYLESIPVLSITPNVFQHPPLYVDLIVSMNSYGKRDWVNKCLFASQVTLAGMTLYSTNASWS